MAVPSLEAIIISETIRRKWRFSIADWGWSLLLAGGWSKQRKLEIDRAITETTTWFLKNMAKHHLPSYLQQRWAMTFNGIVREALHFVLALASEANPQLEPYEMMMFARMVVISQNCTVDTTKTILAVLEHEEMGIMFTQNFMLSHLVMKDDLLRLLAKLNADVSKRENYRAPKIISKESEQLRIAHRAIINYTDIKALAAQGNNYSTPEDHFLLITRYLSENTHSKLFEHWMGFCCPSEQVLIEIANEVFEYFDDEDRNVPAELAMLLFEHLTKEKLLEATQAPPRQVFSALAGSWRSRHLCADWFLLLLPRLDARESGALLTQLAGHLEDDRLQVGQILTRIWKNMPENHKNDIVMRKNVSCLLLNHYFQEGIVALLEDYDLEKANEILMWSLQETLTQSKLNTQALETLVREMRKLFGNQSNVYLEESQLKTLLNVRKYAIFTPQVLDKLLALTCGDRATLKRSLTTDLEFITSVLNRNWGSENTWTFLHWLLEYDGQAVHRYLRRVERSVLGPLFAKKIHSCIPGNAAAGLAALRRDPHAAFTAALRDADLRATLTGRLIQAAASPSFSTKNWEILWSCRGTLKSLLSAEGKQAILDIVTKETHRSLGTNFAYSHLSSLKDFKNICSNLLRPNGLCALMDAHLAEAGHPNAGSPRRPHDAERRQLVDFRYRALRALLARDLALPEMSGDDQVRLPGAPDAAGNQPPSKTMTATEVSVALAEMAQLEVPIVI